MSTSNTQLYVLAEALVGYAISKNWSVSDVESTIKAAMAPMRRLEARARVEKLAKELTLSQAQDTLISAMGDYWDSDVMFDFFRALKLRFPKRVKSISRIDDWAGDASCVRCECGVSSDYNKLADKAFNALLRLPWHKKA